MLNQRARLPGIDIAGENQYGIIGTVIAAEPAAHIVHAGGIEIGHAADGRMAIGMAFGKLRRQLGIFGQAERIIVALALFILHDAALQIELCLGDGAEHMPHAVGFEIQRQRQRRRGDIFEIIGAVEPGRAVEVGGADAFQRLDIATLVVFAAAEHQMFEQMRKAGATLGFVLRSDMIPDADRDDRSLAIGMDDDPQAILQREAFMRNIDSLDQRCHRRRGSLRGDGGRGEQNGAGERRGEQQGSGNRQAHENSELNDALRECSAISGLSAMNLSRMTLRRAALLAPFICYRRGCFSPAGPRDWRGARRYRLHRTRPRPISARCVRPGAAAPKPAGAGRRTVPARRGSAAARPGCRCG